MTAITDLGIFGIAIAAFTAGAIVGWLVAIGTVHLVARIAWHIWVMTRRED